MYGQLSQLSRIFHKPAARYMYTAIPTNTIVFAKTIGFEPYPATIKRYNSKKNVYSVTFINHKSHSTVAPDQVQQFNLETVDYFREKYKNSQSKQHKNILRSIEKALPIYRKQKTKREKEGNKILQYAFAEAGSHTVAAGSMEYQRKQKLVIEPIEESSPVLEVMEVQPSRKNEEEQALKQVQDKQQQVQEAEIVDLSLCVQPDPNLKQKPPQKPPKTKVCNQLRMLGVQGESPIKIEDDSGQQVSESWARKIRRLKGRKFKRQKQFGIPPQSTKAFRANSARNKKGKGQWKLLQKLPKIQEKIDGQESSRMDAQTPIFISLDELLAGDRMEEEKQIPTASNIKSPEISWDIIEGLEGLGAKEIDSWQQEPDEKLKRTSGVFMKSKQYLTLMERVPYRQKELNTLTTTSLLDEVNNYIKILCLHLTKEREDGSTQSLLSMERSLTLIAALENDPISDLCWGKHQVLRNLFNFVLMFERAPSSQLTSNCQFEYIACRSKLNMLCNRMLMPSQEEWGLLYEEHVDMINHYRSRGGSWRR